MFAVRGDDEVDVPVGMAVRAGVTNVFTEWINLESFLPTGAGISAELINCGENRQNGEADETK